VRRLLPLLLAAPFLSGCVSNEMRATTDGVNFVHMTPEEAHAVPRCPWRACVLADDGVIARTIRDGLSAAFASVAVATDMEQGRRCDVGFKFESLAWGDHSDVISAYSGEKLIHLDANYLEAGRIACAMLSLDGREGTRLAQQRVAAGLPPVAGSMARIPAPPPAPAAAPVAVAAAPVAPEFSSDVETPSYRLPEREHDFAIVVGVENYSDLPKAQYAARDARAFAAHAKALGVPPRNVVLLTDQKAGLASMDKYLDQWLPRMVQPDSRVYFYFSGHGAPDVKTGQAYLVPWDGDPNFLDTTAYPVKRLYDRLGKLHAQRVIVAMDACFSGAGGRSVLASGARPLITKIDTGAVAGPVTVLTASGANEISGSLDDRGHGAFTYFLLKGLNGAAKDFSASGLLGYATPRVQDEARRLNRDQTPQLLGDGSVLLR